MDQQRPLRILLTHPKDRDDADLIGPLLTAGFEIIHQPLIQTLSLPFVPPIQKDFDWLFFTSATAVHSFFAQDCKPHFAQTAVVGPHTAEALLTYTAVDFVSSVYEGPSAVEQLNQRYGLKNKSVLWPCARQSNPNTKKAFINADAKLTPFVVYETQPIAHHFEASFLNTTDLMVFTSPSAVAAFQCDPNTKLPPVFCIGPSTADRAQASLGQVMAVASPSTYFALASLILEWSKSQKEGRSS